ncbi:class I adenylate-forming enzyme family protein [Dactylosporangium sp. CA-233914]|uniref:class I adenylate-forming enzyme family protein n=1 Tax=Dactylosporangium sp. CA-233914 TaxID=3239934 RepID=UPI003D9339C3
MIELLETAAEAHGDRMAWSFFEDEDNWSFRQVRDGAHRAANALLELGVRHGDRVAVMVPNGSLYLQTWLGLAIIGAAIVPVNARYTPREVLHVVETSAAGLLILDPQHDAIATAVTERHERGDLACVTVFSEGMRNSFRDQVTRQTTGCRPGWTARPDDLLNVQFTSGTTGLPKGCMLTHRYWTIAAVSWDGYLDVPVDRVLVNQMLFYVDGQFLAMFALRRGATLFCARRPSASSWLGWVREHRINAGFYFDPMFKTSETDVDADNELAVLTTFGFQPARHSALETRFRTRVRESYGMTELAPALVMPLNADVTVGSASCGLPAPFCEAKVVDANGVEVAPGVTGQLVLRSPAQMTGYYDDPNASAEAIRDGWLHTGDLFRRDEDGFFYMVGRMKDMVRRNSENVACAEVESVLRLSDLVAEAAVVGVPDDRVGEEIKAYLQLRPDVEPASVDLDELLAFCRRHLAVFKVPRYFTFVDQLPMTESARVSKSALLSASGVTGAKTYDSVTGCWAAGVT